MRISKVRDTGMDFGGIDLPEIVGSGLKKRAEILLRTICYILLKHFCDCFIFQLVSTVMLSFSRKYVVQMAEWILVTNTFGLTFYFRKFVPENRLDGAQEFWPLKAASGLLVEHGQRKIVLGWLKLLSPI